MVIGRKTMSVYHHDVHLFKIDDLINVLKWFIFEHHKSDDPHFSCYFIWFMLTSFIGLL